MYFIKEFLLLVFLSLLIDARRRFDIRNETRKNLSNNSKKNFDNTVNGLNRINRLQKRLMGIRNKTEVIDDNSEVLLELPMGNPNLYQGDIILTDNQVTDIVSDIVQEAHEKKIDVSDIENSTDILNRKKRSVTTNMYYKWTFPIPYYVDSGVDAALVDSALSQIAAETCVRFSKSSTPITNKSGLKYYFGSGCWSYLGRVYSNAPQEVSIGNGCGFNGIIQHETAHALGVHHEQTRPNRDNFVLINTANIISGTESNFVKSSNTTVSDYGVPYDYGSAMHYGRYGFSKNGLQTITSKDTKYDKTMGQYLKLSFNDIKLINFKYCNSTCTTKITCNNGGYQNPNNCLVCKCPSGFTGNTCSNIVQNTATACGSSLLTATTTVKNLKVTGFLNCYYYITTTANYRIKINLTSTNLFNFDPCIATKSLEIRYKKDKTITGYNFCGTNTNQIIISEGNSVLINYVGRSSTHSFDLSYVRL